MISNGPSCACNMGYRADPFNGLTCIPLVPSQQIPRSKASSAEQRKILERSLERNLEEEFRDFETGQFEQNRKWDFATYLERKTVSHRAGMAVLTIPVAFLLMSGGIGMMEGATGSYWDEAEKRYRDRINNTPLYASGVVVMIEGVASLITGAVLWAQDDRILRRIRRSDFYVPTSQDSARTRLVAVVPYASRRGNGGGLSLLMEF